MTTWEALLEEAKKQTNILAEISNQQSEIIHILNKMNWNTINIMNNTAILNPRLKR